MNALHKFTINNIAKKLNKINCKISLSHQKPFPKPLSSLLSKYEYKKDYVHLNPNGGIQGGYAKMITSLIDFSFIRSLVADAYSPLGRPPYDPVSIFLIDIFRYIDGYQEMAKFLPVVQEKDRGRGYRTYAGINPHDIPSEGTFSQVRKQIGEARYNEIFHVLVEIFHELQMITFNILAHDGTLYPTWARYKGCTYFCEGCSSIKVPDVYGKVRNSILYRLNNMAKSNLGSEVRVHVGCPSNRFPKDMETKKPRIEVFAFRLAYIDGELTTEQKNTAVIFGVDEELARQQLCIQTIRSNLSNLDPIDGSLIISCPKLPKDTDAKIGVRKDPKNPDKTQKIFGYNAVLTTSVEIHLGIELPVALTNISGNAEEGSQLIVNKKQISKHHACQVKVDIADAKYDIISNYEYIRNHGAIPIIDYNPRNEKLSKDDLLARGYDQNGTPFAPCGLLTKTNGFDQKYQRLTFCCFKQCLKLRAKAMGCLQNNYDLAKCPYIQNGAGYTKHLYVKEHPRLINAIPRGSKKYQILKRFRIGSERINSALKEDIAALDEPRVMNGTRAAILAHMATIALLLKRAFSFIVRITNQFRKQNRENDPRRKDNLNPPYLPISIQKLVQLE